MPLLLLACALKVGIATLLLVEHRLLLLHVALRVVHIRLLISILDLGGGGALLCLLVLDYELEHLELVVLHCTHVLHLLLVDAFGLLEHAAMVA